MRQQSRDGCAARAADPLVAGLQASPPEGASTFAMRAPALALGSGGFNPALVLGPRLSRMAAARARSLLAPQELPVGVLTGDPRFYLLAPTHRRRGALS